MEQYYLRSIVGEIAKGVEKLIAEGVISKDKKVLLYGLDRNSFAMRTVLENLGYCNIEGYFQQGMNHHQVLLYQKLHALVQYEYHILMLFQR